MTLCERCVHKNVCEIRSVQDEDDERALVECSNFFEVVRCKDCKHFLNDTDYCKKHNKGYCEWDDTIKSRKHFCSYGERKGVT